MDSGSYCCDDDYDYIFIAPLLAKALKSFTVQQSGKNWGNKGFLKAYTICHRGVVININNYHRDNKTP